jgi:diketogulonate reductase-like aldo/keto reductase
MVISQANRPLLHPQTSDVLMSSGLAIPQIGLGLWQVKDQTQFNAAFTSAIAAGYRHFDTAQIYHNEQMLGAAWTASSLQRKDLFITTKISVTQFAPFATRPSFHRSLDKLQTDYVDLLLLHFPVPILRRSAWNALQTIYHEGGARSIGVSNYTIKHLEALKKYGSVVPVVNQVELHVFLQQPELIDYCSANNIIVEAYSPLAHGRRMDNAVVAGIAIKHEKTVAQVMLRWCIEQGCVVIPKSVNPNRIKENIDLFDFSLDAEDISNLTALNENLRTCWDPTRIP